MSLILGSSQIALLARTSTERTNKYGDGVQPSLTPLSILKQSLIHPLFIKDQEQLINVFVFLTTDLVPGSIFGGLKLCNS